MTTSDLGRQLKAAHPGFYGDIEDAKLGAALKSKHPGFFDHATHEPDLDSGTIPETPKTLAIQLQQLSDGLRRVVFIARGSKVKIDPKQYGAKKIILPPGEFIYDPQAIKAKEIIAAVQNHELASILGSAELGYGAPSKESLQGEPMAVVSRDADGDTAHSALTDSAHLGTAIEAAQGLVPENGTVNVEPPQHELANRADSIDRPDPSTSASPLKLKKRPGGRWMKPGAIPR